MELNIRDWMLVIGVLLFLAVALDGYRRARGEKRNQVRLSKNAKRMQAFYEEQDKQKERDYTSELPNGGARVKVEVGSDVSEQPIAVDSMQPLQKEKINTTSHTERTESPNKIEPSLGAAVSSHPDSTNNDDVDPLFADPFHVNNKVDADEQVSHHTSVSASSTNEITMQQPSLFDQQLQVDEAEKIIVLNVLATDSSGFSGEELLHVLLACDCRFGEMNIFHRYEAENASGQIQFSIVNLVEPGVFELEDIKHFSTPGVSFFMRLPGPENPLMAYDCMVETAQCLVKNLKGVLKDEGHSAATEQTIGHCRQEIRDFIQHKLVSS